MFRKKSYRQSHKEYFRNATYPAHDLSYLSHDNIFPKWYAVADRITMDETGTKSYFLKSSSYLEGGWVGATVREDENGVYGTDPVTGENYYWQHLSPQGQQLYYQMQSEISTLGYLAKFYFAKPSEQMLQSYGQNGYNTQVTPNIIKVWNLDIRITWRLDKKELIIEHLINNVISSTITSRYTYNTQFSQYLKHQETTITPSQFENGDCYDHIIQIGYSDYDTPSQLQLRASNGLNAHQFTIFPNPTAEYLTLVIPMCEKPTQIEIVNSSGNIVSKSSIASKKLTDVIDVRNMAAGIYFVSMKQENKIQNLKFVKN
jgi:hypothetical protein